MTDFSYDRDPLRIELLPGGWERRDIGLSFRSPGTRGPVFENRFVPYIVVCVALACLVGLLVARALCNFLTPLTLLLDPAAIAAVVLLALLLGVRSFVRDDPPVEWMTHLLVPPFVWLILVCVCAPSWGLLLLLLVTTLYLVDAAADNHMAWLLADVRQDEDTRARLAERWRARFGREAWLDALMAVLDRGHRPRLLDLYPLGFALYAALVLLSIVALRLWPGLTTGLLVVIALLAALLIYGLALHHVFGLKPVSYGVRLRLTLKAIDTWFNYNPRDRKAPGLHQSPRGPAPRRIAAAVAGLALTGLTVNLTAAYYPVLMLGPTGARPWAEVAADLAMREAGGWWERTETLAESEAPQERLTGSQLDYYERLGSEQARRAYLRSLDRRARQDQVGRELGLRVARRDYASLRTSPERWLVLNGLGAVRGGAIYLWSTVLSLVLGTLVPPLMLVLTGWALASYPLALVAMRLRNPAWLHHAPGADGVSPADFNQEWLRSVERLFHSRDESARNHLFLGYLRDPDSDDEAPALLHRSILRQHMHITGDSGSGKTSRGIAALATQLALHASVREDCSILVIDLKGDDALFHGLRHAAAAGSIPFSWYREQLGCATFGFNPLLQSHLELLSPDHKAQMLMDAFGMSFKDSFGGQYYSDMHESVLYKLLRHYPDAATLAELARLAADPANRRTVFGDVPEGNWQDSYHIRQKLDAFSRCAPMNATDGPLIDLPQLFHRPQIVYFYVPALLGGQSNQQAAKFALYSLLTYAALSQGGGRRRQVYCIIDEFQEIVAANLGVILKQARSFNVGMILANQLPADLARGTTNLRDQVHGNTAVKWSFRVSDEEQQESILKASGEYRRLLFSRTQGTTVGPEGVSVSSSLSASEQFGPAMDRNALLWASFLDNLSVLQVSHGRGYTQYFRPTVLRTLFHVGEDLYERWSNEPWPGLPAWASRTGS